MQKDSVNKNMLLPTRHFPLLTAVYGKFMNSYCTPQRTLECQTQTYKQTSNTNGDTFYMDKSNDQCKERNRNKNKDKQ